MRIKVTSLCCLTSKERHGLQKKMRENKRAKSSSVKKREREKKKSSHALSQKEAREGKLLKGVPLPPTIPHTCTS